MDSARGYERATEVEVEEEVSGPEAPPPAIGTDERRMHVRAYNYWVSLLDGRAYPSIHDLQPDTIVDFGPHSVLLDFTGGLGNPAVPFLGAALRVECGIEGEITHVADVPSRSLLSRLTDHYLQIIANRAPIGFEAEFVGQRGNNTLYRGILMPFSSDGDTIDFIYGVINWKELVDPALQAQLTAEIGAAVHAVPAQPAPAVWADGPSAGLELADDDGADDAIDEVPIVAPLADQLMLARECAAQVRAADTRSRAALYRALARAHDFAVATMDDAEGYARLLADAGLKGQERAPMTPIVKLVFGADYDKTRLTEFASVLAYARRTGVGHGGLLAMLDAEPGGIKGIVAAERVARRPAAAPLPPLEARLNGLRRRKPIAALHLDAEEEWVLLVARRDTTGAYGVVGRLPAEITKPATVARAV